MGNGTVVTGTVVGVDATMNTHLKKVKVTVRGKNPQPYTTLSIRGNTIRSWLLPDSMNLDALLVEDKVRNTSATAGVAGLGTGSGGVGRGRGRTRLGIGRGRGRR